MLVFDTLMLAVRVEVRADVRVRIMLVETVVVADWVFVLAAVADPHELCVEVFELLVDEV